MAQLIFSIRELFESYLNLNKKQYFNIPEYQRGYKWSTQQIRQMLNDIDTFDCYGNDDRYYCMQNITIVEKATGSSEQFFNIIDGQQRLTTLVLLLSYLGETELVKRKIKYSIRPITEKYIVEYILQQKDLGFEDWNDLLDNLGNEYNHQDIYFLFNARHEIEKWFVEKNRDKESYKHKLKENVKLIVNKVDVENEQELFGNLNSGKVSLDGADLVRALLITNIAKEELLEHDINEVKSIVQLNERRVKIGDELDKITAWWNKEEIRNYFDWLQKIETVENEAIVFDSSNYSIDLLYKLYIASKGIEKIKLNYFETDSYTKLYKEILNLHRTIQDWYQDCEIYHYLRFLFDTCRKTRNNAASFYEIWSTWQKANTSKEFANVLKAKVKASFRDPLEIQKEDWYNDKDLEKVLVLLDIIQIENSRRPESENRMPFLGSEFFSVREEDKEHIFPQTPISEKDINKEDKSGLKKKIEEYTKLLAKENISIEIDIDWDKSEGIDQVLRDSINKLNEETLSKIHIHSIGNLCLLNLSINRSYGNDFYSRKRIAILNAMRNGKFIRPHTLQCFDKGFIKLTDDDNGMNQWSMPDICQNTKYIEKQIEDFFKDIG